MIRYLISIAALFPSLCMAGEGAADRLVTNTGNFFVFIICLFFGLAFLAFIYVSIVSLWEKSTKVGRIIFFGIPSLAIVSAFVYYIIHTYTSGTYEDKALASIILIVIGLIAFAYFANKAYERIAAKIKARKKPKQKKENRLKKKVASVLFKQECAQYNKTERKRRTPTKQKEQDEKEE